MATQVLLADGVHINNTGQLELATGVAAASTIVGLIVLFLGWALHHKASHRGRRHDFLSKALIVAGTTIVFGGSGATLLEGVNNWTEPGLKSFAGMLHLSTAHWPPNAGVLTLIEVLLLVWFGFEVRDAFKGERGRGGAGGRGTMFAKYWDILEAHFEKYGIFLVAPLTATIPGKAGAVCAMPFAALAAVIGHFFTGILG